MPPIAVIPHVSPDVGQMFLDASVLVQLVMLGLAAASVLSWTIFLLKVRELRNAARQLDGAYAVLINSSALAQAAADPMLASGLARAFADQAQDEVRDSGEFGNPEALQYRLDSRLDRLEAGVSAHLRRGIGVLASIGATAPFVGLFGTVWGIMTSFVGIARARSSSLAVVAPGIAEALLATAFGLAAAIPAVIFYNVLARRLAGTQARMADTSAALLRLVSRDLERAAHARREAR